MSAQHNRIEWVDVAKAIGILLVICAHAYLPKRINTIIYSFHIPLFFVLSGYTCNCDVQFKDFAIRRIKGLLIPYFFLSSLCLAWFILLRNFANTQLDIGETITGICLGIGTYVNTPMWFITCLFCVNVLMYFITKCIRNFKIRNLFILCVSVICYLYSRFIGIKLPCSLVSGGIALVFWGGGVLN